MDFGHWFRLLRLTNQYSAVTPILEMFAHVSNHGSMAVTATGLIRL